MIDFITSNKEFFGIVVPLVSVLIPLWTFLIRKNKEQKLLNFRIFHDNLMKGLANQETNTGLDQQVAIVYELKNYPEYFPVIKRLLTFQKKRWLKELNQKSHFHMLITESEMTLEFINKSKFNRYVSKYK